MLATSGKETLRSVLLHVQKSLQLKSFEDWYKITLRDLKPFLDVNKLLRDYKSCHVTALLSAFPGTFFFVTNIAELPWQVYKFVRVPKHYWRNRNHRRAFFDSLGLTTNFLQFIPSIKNGNNRLF